MQKAQQQLLIQTSNQILMQIRQMEVNYLINFFSQYNTLAGLLAGFQLVSITQVVVQTYDVNRALKSIYWVTTAGTFCPSIHCVLMTSFLIVYGPNLAIRGPLGSMKRAIDMMVHEQKEVFLSFVLTLVVFTISVTVTFWLEAYTPEAAICTFVMITGAYINYHYCLRIYNRFKFDEEWFVDKWNKSSNEKKLVDDADISRESVSGLMAEVIDTSVLPVAIPMNNEQDDGLRISFSTTRSGTQKLQKKSILGQLLKRDKDTYSSAASVIGGHNNRSSTAMSEAPSTVRGGASGSVAAPAQVSDHSIFKAGYMSMKSSKVSLVWTRYYFMLKGNNIWYYKDKQSHEEAPEKALSTRPISMEHYNPVVISHIHPYRIGLRVKPDTASMKLKEWELTVDTLDELNEWMKVLTYAAAVVYQGVINPAVHS